MAIRSISLASRGVRIGLVVAGVVGVATSFVAWKQLERERKIDEDDLSRRASVLAYQMSESIRKTLAFPDAEAQIALKNELEGHKRLLGFAVFRPDGRLISAGKGVGEFTDEMRSKSIESSQMGVELTGMMQISDSSVHFLAYPIRDRDGAIRGSLIVAHDASNLEERHRNGGCNSPSGCSPRRSCSCC